MFNISSKSQYGLRALAFLAKKDRLVSIADIAETEHIPYEFLEKIIQQLKRGNILLSERGARGGYALAKNPEDISLKMILEVLGDLKPPVKCIEHNCEIAHECSSRGVWGKVYTALQSELSQISLADFASEKDHSLNYTHEELISCSR